MRSPGAQKRSQPKHPDGLGELLKIMGCQDRSPPSRLLVERSTQLGGGRMAAFSPGPHASIHQLPSSQKCLHSPSWRWTTAFLWKSNVCSFTGSVRDLLLPGAAPNQPPDRLGVAFVYQRRSALLCARLWSPRRDGIAAGFPGWLLQL